MSTSSFPFTNGREASNPTTEIGDQTSRSWELCKQWTGREPTLLRVDRLLDIRLLQTYYIANSQLLFIRERMVSSIASHARSLAFLIEWTKKFNLYRDDQMLCFER